MAKKKAKKPTVKEQLEAKFEARFKDIELRIPSNDIGVVVAVPTVGKEKMQAIVNISQAILETAQALNGAITEVTVKDCTFRTVSGIGVKVEAEQKLR